MSRRSTDLTLTELMAGTSSGDAAVKDAGSVAKRRSNYRRNKLNAQRDAKGRKLLTQLTPRYLDMITMYLTGKHSQIAIANSFGCSPASVQRVINDPLAQNIINSYLASVAADFKAMSTLVNDAIRNGLTSGNSSVNLRAVDRYVKILAMQQGTSESLTHNLQKKEQTENDVISKLQKMREDRRIIDGVEIDEGEITDVSDTGQISTSS